MANPIDLRLVPDSERLRERMETRDRGEPIAGESRLRDSLRVPEVAHTRLTQDGFEVKGHPTALALHEGGERTALTHPTEIVPMRTAASAPIDPIKYLRNVESADLVIRVPGIPGKYGHSITDFAVAPGTEMIVHAKVRDGVVVPGETMLSFEPPLKNRPLGIPTWIKTESISLHDNGDGSSSIKLDLEGFPNWNITSELLDVRSLPNALEQLTKLIQRDEVKAEANVETFVGGQPFDYAKFNIELADVQLKEGVLPLGTDQAQLVLGRHSRVTVKGTADALRIEGHLRLNSFTATSGGSSIELGHSHAHAIIHTAIDTNTFRPKHVKVELHTIAGTVGLSDGQGKRVFVSGNTGEGGRIHFATDLSLGATPNLQANLTDGKLKLTRGEVSFDDASGRTTHVKLGEGEIVGRLQLEDNVLRALVSGTKLTAETKNVQFGDGALALSATHAEVKVTNGTIRLDHSGAHFAGKISVDGKIGSGHIGRRGGPLSLKLAENSKVKLTLSEASIGKDTHAIKGSGSFFAHLAAGDIELGDGSQVSLKEGSLAQVDATDISSDASGQRIGKLDIKTYARPSFAPESVSTAFAKVLRVEGAEFGAHVILDEVSLDAQGSLRVGRERARIHGAFDTAEAQLDPQAVFAGGKAPALKAVLSEISSAQVRFDLPIPARKLGSGILRVFEIKPGTVAHFTMPVSDGKIDRSRVELHFSPPIDGPLWVKDRGIKADRDGNFIVKLTGFPDINLSKLLLGKVTMPETLGELPAIGTKVESFLQKTVGRVITLGNPLEDPLGELKRAGATLDIRDVSLKTTTHAVGDGARLMPTHSNFSLSVRDGVATVAGQGAGKVSLKLSGGAVSLGDGSSLELAAGTDAAFTFDHVSWRPGSKTPEAHGTMHFSAKLSGRLPEGGLKLSDTVTLTALGTHDGMVDVTVDDVTLKRDGKLALGKLTLELNLEKRLRNGLVFMKERTAPALSAPQ